MGKPEDRAKVRGPGNGPSTKLIHPRDDVGIEPHRGHHREDRVLSSGTTDDSEIDPPGTACRDCRDEALHPKAVESVLARG